MRYNDQQRNVPQPVDKQVHGFQGGGVGPLGVLEQHHCGLLSRRGFHDVDERAQSLVLELLRRHWDGAITRLVWNGEHCRDQARVIARTSVLADNERFQLFKFLLRGFIARKL